MTKATEQTESLLGNYVFMEKTQQALDIGFKTGKNVLLYGPGGHGKSELSEEFLREKGLVPYIITMGKGMTADRLFGGINIPLLDSGKIEYLVENSFMNHEFVILEEMLDAQDSLLEQLKDILSSGYFRNGTQIFEIKTKFIIANTNKTREEFAKSSSLKALMERFPLEHNVVWDNYTEPAYNTLLENRFGQGNVDPIIPFLLQEYSRNNIVISPRIALDCYEVYEDCGPDALMFIAEFARRPQLITSALQKYEVNVSFRKLGAEIEDIVKALDANQNAQSEDEMRAFMDDFRKLSSKHGELSAMTVSDEMVTVHSQVMKAAANVIGSAHRARFNSFDRVLRGLPPTEEEHEVDKAVQAAQAKARKSRYGYENR